MIQLGPLTVGQLTFAAPVTFGVAELDALPREHADQRPDARPARRSRDGRHAGDRRPSSGPGGPVYTRHDAHSAELAVKIERHALEEELAGAARSPDRGTDRPAAGHEAHRAGRGRAGAGWSGCCATSCDYDESLIYQPLIAEQLRSSVLSGLLLSVPHRYHDELIGAARRRAAAGHPPGGGGDPRRAGARVHRRPTWPGSPG